ncbi:MAG TPA: alpha/beta hydrolase, partial [Sphingomicrobium sp.]
ERVATLAAPWNFSHYPADSRSALADMWRNSEPASRALGALPMEVLQAAFWSLDPQRTVGKFAEFGRFEPGSAEQRRFVALEDWANEGEPLPYPAARELIEDLFGRDLPGSGEWRVGDQVADDALAVPALHILAGKDRIAPAPAAPDGPAIRLETGHVGMIVGSARTGLHAGLRQFLDPACRSPS